MSKKTPSHRNKNLSLNSLVITVYTFISVFLIAIFAFYLSKTEKYNPTTYAATKTVSTISELQSAVNAANAGDVIEVMDGAYTQALNVTSKQGTETSPITIKAKNSKQAKFASAGQIIVSNSKHIVIEGFNIASYKYNPILINNSENIRVTRNYFYVSESSTADSVWLYVKGNSKHVRIDHNDFRDKKGLGRYIAVHGDGQTMAQYTTIDHNYFYNNAPRVSNGKETLQIGLAEYTYSPSYTVIEYNLFENNDGDPETISIKSSNNTIRYNTFINNEGMVVLRHGNNSKVESNTFFGGSYGTGGVRVHGENHLVKGNYFENLQGINSWAAITVPQGTEDAGSTNLKGHFRAINTRIENNVIQNNDYGITLGNSSSKPPRNTQIIGNIFSSNRGKLLSLGSHENTTWSGNKGYVRDSAYIGATLQTTQLQITNPNLVPYMQDNGSSIKKYLPQIQKLTQNDVGPQSDKASATPRPSSTPTTDNSTILNPVKTALIYQLHRDVSSDAQVSTNELAQKLNLWIVHRGFETHARDARAAGNKGPILQYIIADALIGPDNLSSLTAQRTPCTQSQKDFKPWTNNVTLDQGAFCQIHDSIVLKTGFDHDLNTSTPNVVATESWFLHNNSTGERISRSSGGGIGYYPNPANQHLKEYFVARMLREKNKTPGVFDGFFLDNIGLGWENVNRQATPKEYGTSADYADAVFSFTSYLSQLIQTDQNYPLYANLIGGNNNGTQWDRYNSVLKGAMNESFALNWGKGPFSATTIENQIAQAEKWMNAGNNFIAIAQGTGSNTTAEATFATATLLLATNGRNSYMHYTNYNRMYRSLYDFRQLTEKLGMPISQRQKTSTSPVVYTRQFQCGSVEVIASSGTGTITVRPNCMPSTTPRPSTTAIPSPTLNTTAKPTTSPTASPKATPTPTPQSKLTVSAAGSYSGTAPIMGIIVDDNTFKTQTVSNKTLTDFNFTLPSKISVDRLKISYQNDGGDRDLRVEKIILDGTTYLSNASSVYSTGTWKEASGCAPGYKQSVWLHCPGYFKYR